VEYSFVYRVVTSPHPTKVKTAKITKYGTFTIVLPLLKPESEEIYNETSLTAGNKAPRDSLFDDAKPAENRNKHIEYVLIQFLRHTR
jgi:hypothetical protein